MDFYQDAGIWIVIASCVAEYLLLITYIAVAAYEYFKNRKSKMRPRVRAEVGSGVDRVEEVSRGKDEASEGMDGKARETGSICRTTKGDGVSPLIRKSSGSLLIESMKKKPFDSAKIETNRKMMYSGGEEKVKSPVRLMRRIGHSPIPMSPSPKLLK